MIKMASETSSPAASATSHPGFDQALALFHKASRAIPAYKDFLQRQGVNPTKIQTVGDFDLVPVITKQNYLTQYSLQDMLWQGSFKQAQIISMSSGSSGQPFFWPRGELSTSHSAEILEYTFSHVFKTKEKKTLAIIAFAMGTWIAGTYMLDAMFRLTEQGHAITSITPGITKEETLRILEQISDDFDQVILMGYPPFVKDILDAAEVNKIDLGRYNLRLLFAGENFSEKWRDYLLTRLKKKDDIFTSIAMYGTADAGIMGVETPLSIFARRAATQDKSLFKLLFPDTTILPSLVQYNPNLRYCEVKDDFLLFTINNTLPIIRYQIMDYGRLISDQALRHSLNSQGHTLPSELKHVPKRPYIALYGRPDVATIFYSLNIYPENIKYGLEMPQLLKLVTGKFILKTKTDDNTQEQTLELYVELKHAIAPTPQTRDLILSSVLASLQANNSEYRKLHSELKHKAEPKISLIAFGSPEFQINVKHQWSAKS